MPEAQAHGAALAAFRSDVLRGLALAEPAIPPKYFYDARGSALFEQITELPEYYLTRVERQILAEHAAEMAEALGPGAVLLEYGSGSSRKTRLLLDALPDLAAYVPVDISAEALAAAAEALRLAYPRLRIEPVGADYTAPGFRLPELPSGRRVAFFSGSSIGNYEPAEAAAFLRRAAALLGPGGGLLIGIDLRKERAALEAAYDDAEGLTAAFNLNLLARINRELGGTFDLGAWCHRALWNEAEGRVEMYLVSRRAQTAEVGGVAFRFAEGAAIHTENSYKYTVEGFAREAGAAGFRLQRAWHDDARRFAVLYFVIT